MPDTQLVAVTPAELAPAQASLRQFCQQKILGLSRELAELRENLRIAKRAKWRHTGWLKAVARTKARMIYYTKIRRAVEAGYLVVPNFDVQVMAVRVDRISPPAREDSYRSNRVTTATPDLLPPGVGRYVDDGLFSRDLSYEEPDPKNPGKTRTVGLFRASEYDLPDFPVRVIKPAILRATERAMALRIFDRISVVTGRKTDPIVVGEILDPIAPGSRWWVNRKRLSFFIGWWLDLESL